MQFTTPVLTLLLAAFSTAAPTDLVERQGGVFVAVGNKYNAGGCTGTALGDPIFGNGNVCQPLDRFGDGAPIVSYKLLSASAGCNVTLYTGANCGGVAFSATVNNCVQGGTPFISTFVSCPPP